VPPLHEVFKMAGLDLPHFLAGQKDDKESGGPTVKVVPIEELPKK
jgi:hypothetical protein